MRQELRFACRALLRSRGYASAAIITLALGLGVNIAVGTVAWSVLFRPLPIAAPERVVMIYPARSGLERSRQPISFLKFREWRARNSVFEDVAVSTPFTIQLSDVRGEDIKAAGISDNFLRALGIRPAEGRLLEAGDRHGTEGAVACIVSAAFARKTSETSLIGRRLDVVNADQTSVRLQLLVVGVMPDGFERWHDPVDVWLPAEAPNVVWREELSSSGYQSFFAVGRLRPGVSIEQAGAAMGQLDREYESVGAVGGYRGRRRRCAVQKPSRPAAAAALCPAQRGVPDCRRTASVAEDPP
jgi:putative ABC transport system permease protein